MNRPCIGCGVLVDRGSRCGPCTPRRKLRDTAAAGNDWRWRKLSQRVRKASPFCELRLPGCTRNRDLTCDHIVPVSVKPEWAYTSENLRTACRSCNAARGTNYTQAEHDQVLAAITTRKQRWTNYMDATSD